MHFTKNCTSFSFVQFSLASETLSFYPDRTTKNVLKLLNAFYFSHITISFPYEHIYVLIQQIRNIKKTTTTFLQKVVFHDVRM